MLDSAALLARFNQAQVQLVIQTADLPLGTLADMVETGAIDLEPGFQRRERWSVEKQSALVESFLLNVPVPPIYLAEEQNGTYTAIDGKQRLKAISDFIHGRLSLRKLEALSSADGLRFSDLPTEIVNALKLRPFLRVVTLLKQTESHLKYEVFLRLNRGGETLNSQEIRNVAFRGPLNDLICQLSETPFLKSQLKIDSTKSTAYKEMADTELVLRFLTLRGEWEKFSGRLVSEMDDFMRARQFAVPSLLERYSDAFLTALHRCEALWGDQAFRRPEGLSWRDQTLAGMYDAQMLAADTLTPTAFERLSGRRETLLQRTRELFADPIFDTAVRTGTNTPGRIEYRVSKLKHAMEELSG